MFYKFSGFIHGTRGFLNQIEENISIEVYVRDNYDKAISQIYDNRIRSWLKNKNKKYYEDGLINSTSTNEISKDLQDFLHNKYPNKEINVSLRACYKSTGKYLKLYSKFLMNI